MGPTTPFIRRLSLLLAALVLLSMPGAAAGSTRAPVWAGQFYPADRAELTRTLEELTRQAGQTAVSPPPGKTLKGLVLPHAGYPYSGWTAAHASAVLAGLRFERVVLMGPDHRIGFSGAAVSDADAWDTPLGRVKVHPDAHALVDRSDRFRTIPESDRQEHALEVVLPFLQHYLGDFSLVPIVLGRGDIGSLARDIEPLLVEGTLLVVSSDLSHYLSYAQAVAADRRTLELIENFDEAALARRENAACGIVPLLVTLRLARERGWQPVRIHYSNSGDTAGARDRVVGYATIALYGDDMQEHPQQTSGFNDENGRVLVRLARRTIAERLGKPAPLTETDRRRLSDPVFDTPSGTFVTLTLDGRLRGCIGSLSAVEPIREGVRQNAVSAAFHDPRFPPLTAEELDRAFIEVSILSEPAPLPFTDGDDLAGKLRVGVDGVIIQKGGARATFLPQVWKQLPGPEEFLSRLCEKAGLSANAWKSAGLDVFTYQVQYFEEHR